MDLYDQERITDRMLASTRKETKIEDIKSLMTNLKMTAEQAMQALGIPAADQSKYQEMDLFSSQQTLEAMEEAKSISRDPDIKGYVSMEELKRALDD